MTYDHIAALKVPMSFQGLICDLKTAPASVTIAVLAILSVGNLAHAHPGHGDPNVTNPTVHYLTDPFHIGQWLVLVLVVGITLRSAMKMQPVRNQNRIDRTSES